MFLIFFVLIVIAIILWLVKELLYPSQRKNIEGKHVVITGGSSGIGKAAAILAAKKGAHVTIIARDVQKLEAARNEILNVCRNRDTQRIEYLPLDITEDYEAIEKSLLDIEKTMGPIYMLVNCAGTAICGKIEDTTIDNLKWMINLNLMGTYYCTKAVIPRMKSAKDGIIVITSSQAALLGIFGYSAYCSSKFALRGLAESLAMEVNPHNVSVTLCLPPDTDTPGFAIEELSKPLETKLISESAGLVSPEVVAKQLIADACAGKFFSTVGFEGFILTTLSAGMSPVSSIAELFVQFLTMGLLRIVGAFYLFSFQRIIKNCINVRDKNKKSE
ncbi:3-ketodihydrosphingosine reductase [Microplitis mediator]|uniref:3-ketodihydrosphingosine reductase n=1 Tax=Microplitis mediator TaxID=375433 RepID=UPI002554939B|nr:3-ketodihydrosphingosine reductase [Microplitis mediator]